MDLRTLRICHRSFVVAGILRNTVRDHCNLGASGSHISTQSFDWEVLSCDRDLERVIWGIYLFFSRLGDRKVSPVQILTLQMSTRREIQIKVIVQSFLVILEGMFVLENMLNVFACKEKGDVRRDYFYISFIDRQTNKVLYN